ncbi:MAG: SDR family NAD(P)-dependent oxidoreductase [Patescibacteria group bacterium]|nr:SDR family NAD(P)-dependent oxidoreductase [Patescibacteria group bacterium]MDE1941139.1 SDR family NAD(P)-dependent oxidoreductase [Patescibacteria group bacterium]MDE1966968.1 SDR family NAD(P)-dependent oxidoreductase [Patescibacteria group bacterium]
MKTVLITGIGRGIGQALSSRFLKEGWSVLGTYLNTPVPANEPSLKTFELDLSSEESIGACAEAIKAAGTKIDALINNGGILVDDEETRLIPDKLRKTLDVNVIGTASFTEKILPFMAAGGHIVFLSSQAGSLGEMDRLEDSHYPYHYPAYKISKCALNMYVRTLAARMKHEGFDLTVSAVHPGWIRTDMGGDEAPTPPQEAAADIFALVTSRPPTGQFWYKGKKFPW